jgi:hypothetical protein
MACAAREGASGTVACVAQAPLGPQGAHALEAVRAQAELFGLRFAERRREEFVRTGLGEGERQIRELIEAAFLALREGVQGLIWTPPEQEDAPSEFAKVLGRATLIERLVQLEQPADATPFRVRIPYGDLSDRQLADLILDMDLPVWTCWWCGPARGPRNVPGAELARVEYERWDGLLKEAGWSKGMPGPGLVSEPGEAMTR